MSFPSSRGSSRAILLFARNTVQAPEMTVMAHLMGVYITHAIIPGYGEGLPLGRHSNRG